MTKAKGAGIALLALCLLAAPALAESAAEDATDTLFEALDAQDVSGVSVTTPEREFRFDAENGEVSVNGSMADAEAFQTLLDQIAKLPVNESDAFTPEEAPLLTLSVDADGDHLDASFYRADGTDVYASVICAQNGCVRYGLTKAWRVGKLVLTCDGTRILDENGQETPAK